MQHQKVTTKSSPVHSMYCTLYFFLRKPLREILYCFTVGDYKGDRREKSTYFNQTDYLYAN